MKELKRNKTVKTILNIFLLLICFCIANLIFCNNYSYGLKSISGEKDWTDNTEKIGDILEDVTSLDAKIKDMNITSFRGS